MNLRSRILNVKFRNHMNKVGFKVFGISFLLISLALIVLGLVVSISFFALIRDYQDEALRTVVNQTEDVLRQQMKTLETQLVLLSDSQIYKPAASESFRVLLERLYATHSSYINSIYLIENGKLSVGIPWTISYFIRSQDLNLVNDNALRYRFWKSDPYDSAISGRTVTVAKLMDVAGDSVSRVIAFDLNLDTLTNGITIPRNAKVDTLFLFDQNGELLSLRAPVYPYTKTIQAEKLARELVPFLQSNDQQITYKAKSGDSYRILRSDSHAWNWRVVAAVDQSKAYPIFHEMSQRAFIIAAIWIFCSLLAALKLASYIRKPILTISRQMNRGAGGDLKTRIQLKQQDEFQLIAISFNSMMERISELFKDLQIMERHKRHQELKVLQSQINPHFLYNTLNTIQHLSDSDRSEQIGPLIRALVRILQYSIDKVDELVPLKDEADALLGYVELMKHRFGDVFDLDIILTKPCLDQMIPKLTLFPLVENAIFYGLKTERERNHIFIEGVVEEGEIGKTCMLSISDDGPGMDQERIDSLLSSEPSGNKKGLKGLNNLGIRNTNERIKHHFGPAYGLDIQSQPDEGTTVIVTIPYQETQGEGREVE